MKLIESENTRSVCIVSNITNVAFALSQNIKKGIKTDEQTPITSRKK